MDKSAQVLALQNSQLACRTRCYALLAEAGRAAPDAALDRANAQYDATVAELEALLGPDAHCAEVDCDLFGFYSDCYKDRNGFRPRGHVTRKQVQEWMNWSNNAPWDDDEDFCVGSEDFSCVQGLVSDEPMPYEEFEYLEGK